MNIYRILDGGKENIKKLGMFWGDVYDGFIVAAENDEEACQLIHEHIEDTKWNSGWRWPYHNNPFTIQIVGETVDGIEKGVLFQSWSSCG